MSDAAVIIYPGRRVVKFIMIMDVYNDNGCFMVSLVVHLTPALTAPPDDERCIIQEIINREGAITKTR